MSVYKNKIKSSVQACYPWVIVFMSCLFLFYKYIAQVSPSVMTGELMQHFSLHATGLSELVAAYFPAYLLTQLMAGPLLDRFSVRWLSSSAIALMSLSLLGFSHATSLWQAYLWRAGMGMGAAFATVSYLKLAALWFSDQKYAYVAGWLATASSVGGMIAQAPVAYSVQHFGWNHTLYLCALVGAVVAGMYGVMVKDKLTSSNGQLNVVENQAGLSGLKQILKSKKVWLLAIYSGLAWAPMAVFGGLWGDSYLEVAYHATKMHAASLVSISFFGLAVGGPLFGWLANRWNNLYRVMFVGLALSLAGLLYASFAPARSEWLLGFALFLFGFGTAAFMAGFALGKRWFSVLLAASLVSIVNTGDAFFGSFTEPMVGKLMDYFWSGEMVHGAPIFSLHAYHLALVVLPGYLVAAAFVLLIIRRLDNKMH